MAVASWASLGPYAAIAGGAYLMHEWSQNMQHEAEYGSVDSRKGLPDTNSSLFTPEFKAEKQRTVMDKNSMFERSISKAAIQNVNNGNNHVVINIEGSVDQGVMDDLKNLFKTPGVTPAMPAFIGAGSAFKSKDGFN
jgi:diaminopimelate epimerase